MTKAEAIAALDALNKGDAEAAHAEADKILLIVLRQNRLARVADAFCKARERVGFWYA